MNDAKEIKQYILDNIIVDPKTKCWNWQGTFTLQRLSRFLFTLWEFPSTQNGSDQPKGKDLTGKQLLSHL